MKTYTIEVIIEEGCDEFWESLEGKTGCDEVLNLIRDNLYHLADEKIRLIKYEDK